MAYPTVLPLANIASHIQNIIQNVNNGLYAVQQQGIVAFMPTEIKFEFIAIDSFQALPVVTLEGGTNNELTTGNDTAVTTATTEDAPPPGQASQTTTHGETVSTTDGDQTELVGYDPTSALNSPGSYNTPNLGLQIQPFPL